MTDVRLVHFIYPWKVSPQALPAILTDIQSNRWLRVGTPFYGHGVYAFYLDEIPVANRQHVGVVFEVDDALVTEVRAFRKRAIAQIRMGLTVDYLPIRFLGFVNAPAGFASYTGPALW